MNSLEDILDNGVDVHTAELMLNEYSKRIGTINGIYKITDIEYDFNIHGKIVTLECSECGKIIHRTMISGRNKWSELIKTCDCQKDKRKREKEEEFKKIFQKKKGQIIKDALGMVGSDYGDYKIISLSDELIFTLECNKCGDLVTAKYKSIKNNVNKYKKCNKIEK